MKFNRLIGGVFLTVSIILSGFANAQLTAFTGDTSKVGGSGGKKQQSTGCSSDFRVTGAKIKYGDVIDRISYRCTPISATGRWNGNSFWKSYSSSSNPIPATKSATVTCPTHKFIGSVRGWTKKVLNFDVLNKIQFKCYKMDEKGNNVSQGNTVLTLKASNGGHASSWKYCPAHGLTEEMPIYSGWHLDALALRCYKGTVLSINAPAIISPANNGNFASSSAITLRWHAVTAASYYRVSLRDQASNVYIDPVTGNNTSNPFAGKLTSTRFTLSPAALARMAGSGRNVAWVVQACPNDDNANECKASSSKMFRLTGTSRSGALPKPTLRSPANGVFVQNTRPLTLKWDYVTGAKSYLLVVKNVDNGAYLDPRSGMEQPRETPLRLTRNEFTLTYAVMQKLLWMHSITWKVKACRNRNNNQGCGQYSSFRKFDVVKKRKR